MEKRRKMGRVRVHPARPKAATWRLLTLAVASSCLAVSWIKAGWAQNAPIAVTPGGRIKGFMQTGVLTYLGVPYAKPPVGALRWRGPKPVSAWSEVRDATRFSASCFQPAVTPFGPYTAEFFDTRVPSEDCLTLNIWAPKNAGPNLPVLVWIHGGGFAGGSGAIEIYNGTRLAAQGCVVVTLNYRLGPFGFLALPLLRAEAPDHSTGTYGVQDIVAALRWVHTTIAHFGGDPGRVTIAGQSAGAIAVNELLMSPPARGLFGRAIAESGSGMGVGAPTLRLAEQTGAEFLRGLGTMDLATLRALSPDRIQSGVPEFVPTLRGKDTPPRLRFLPAIDGVFVTENPDHATAKVESTVPLLTGMNADEGRRPGLAISPAAFEDAVKNRYSNDADRFLSLYPHASAAQAEESADLIARDRGMAALLFFARQRAGSSAERVYAYLFSHALPLGKGPGWGTFHTAEVPYVFGNLDPKRRPYGAADARICKQLSAYWLAFMRSGTPQGDGLPVWPAMRQNDMQVMQLGDVVGPKDAVTSPARLAAFQAYVEHGGQLSLF